MTRIPKFWNQQDDRGVACNLCGAPFEAHGPAPLYRCDPDAVEAVSGPSEPRMPKGKLGLATTIVVGLLSAGAMASSCASSGIGYRQMLAIERLADASERTSSVPASSTLRVLPSGQVEVYLDGWWVRTKLWLLPDGNVQIRTGDGITETSLQEGSNTLEGDWRVWP